jgi:hypothetical protein
MKQKSSISKPKLLDRFIDEIYRRWFRECVLLDSNTLRQVAWFVNVAASTHCDVISE